jgi:hypothetical protein
LPLSAVDGSWSFDEVILACWTSWSVSVPL